MLESYKINVIAIWENYAIKSQLLINILADIKGYMGNIKSGVFLHVIAKFASFGIFADNLGQQSHRDKFACQISTAGWLTTSCLYYSGGSDYLAV